MQVFACNWRESSRKFTQCQRTQHLYLPIAVQEIGKEIVSQLTALREQGAALAGPLMRCVVAGRCKLSCGSCNSSCLQIMVADNGGQLKLGRAFVCRFCGQGVAFLASYTSVQRMMIRSDA